MLILVVQHEDDCPPALVGGWLAAAGALLDVCRPYAGDELPADLADHDGLLVLGGSMDAGDDAGHAWLEPTRRLARTAVSEGVPVLGICLGHQLLAAALGGAVGRNPAGQQLGLLEVGWHPEAVADGLLGALAETAGPTRGVHWNNDVVTVLPPDAVELAAAPGGEVQAVRYAPLAWGLQLHPEVDEAVLVPWAASDAAAHEAAGIDQAALVAAVAEARGELAATWAPLAESFTAVVGRVARSREA